MKTHAKNNGFTLVELLVVIAVIGILAGLMVPLVQGMHKRALLSDAKDLCIQVADAWALLPIDYGRFPDASILPNHASADSHFAMTPEAGNVLNFWKPRSPIPATDKKVYPQNLADAKVVWSGGGAPDVSEVEKWAADTRFERSVSQKRHGVFPMGSRSEDAGDDTATSAPVGSDYLVFVMLDTDGDGIVHPNAAGLPDTTEVRRRAIAWCKVARADDQYVYSWK